MFKKIILSFLCLTVFKDCEAQNDKRIELSVVPTLGFNVSLPVFTNPNMKEQLSYTKGTASPKAPVAGIGLQIQFWDEWQSTIKIARTAFGSGWRHEIYSETPYIYEKGHRNYSIDMNVLDFTTEKKLATTGSVNIVNQKIKVVFQGLVGMRYAWVPPNYRTDSVRSINVSHRDSVKILRNASAGLSAGLNAQLYINHHRSFKVGVMYTYAPNPVFEFRTVITYFSNYTDKFSTYGGKHELLFYVEYPIRFFGNRKKELL